MLRKCSLLRLAVCATASFSSAQAVAQQACVPPPPGIVAWWPLDETTGTSAADIIGTRPARYAGTPAPSAGEVGGSLRFNGRSDYLAADDSDLWAFGWDGFTIELWANFDAVPGGTLVRAGAVFVGNDEGGGSRSKWFFALGGGFLHFTVYNSASPPANAYLVRAPFTPTVGRWYHLAITKAATRFTIYVDGTPVGSEESSSPIANPGAPLTIGQAESLGFMNGRLDEISIYRRALSTDEVRAISGAGTSGKCKSSPNSRTDIPRINSDGIVNSASSDARRASPGSLISIYGSGIAASEQWAASASDGHMPLSLAGTSVRMGSRDAPLLYVSPHQINAFVPFDLLPGTYPVTVTTAVGASTPEDLTITPTSPAIFPGAVVYNADGAPVSAAHPLMPGDVFVIYCTGLGAVNPPVVGGKLAPSSPLSYTNAVPSVWIGTQAAQIANSVLSPGFIGLYQIGVIAPANLPKGLQPLTVTVGGVTAPQVQIPSAPWVKLTSIWSEQLDNGIIANFLPGGAGTRGNLGHYVLMGTRADGTIHVGAKIDIPSEVSPDQVTVRLALIESDGHLTPVGTGLLNQGTATLTAPVEALSAATAPEYEVVAFEDRNRNGLIDAGEPLARSSPDRFKVITQKRYNLAYGILLDGANTAGLQYPFARSFLNSFLLGGTPSEARQTTSTVSTAELSHSVGVMFTTAGTTASGAIRKYVFPAGSKLSQAILKSDVFQQAIARTLNTACGGAGGSLPKISGTLRFGGDLGLAFGSATADVNLGLTGSQVHVTGSLYDLYDWDFEGAATAGFFGQLLDPMGASVQAGVFTLGGSGDVFRTEVQFDDVIDAPPCQVTCANIGGVWTAQEQGTLTLTISALGETDSDTEPINGQGNVTITQNGCSIQYDPIAVAGLTPARLTPEQLAALKRTGTVTGNSVSVTGVLAIIDALAVPGITVTSVSDNSMQASGNASGISMTLNSTGKLAVSGTFNDGEVSGTFTLTGGASTVATFRRASGAQVRSSKTNAVTTTCISDNVIDSLDAPKLLRNFRRILTRQNACPPDEAGPAPRSR